MESLVKNAYEQLQVALTTTTIQDGSKEEKKKKKKSSSKNSSKSNLLEDSMASFSLREEEEDALPVAPESPSKKKKKGSIAGDTPPTSPKKKKSSSSSSSSSTSLSNTNSPTLAAALQAIRDYSDVAMCPESNAFGTQLLTTLRQPGKKDGIVLLMTALKHAATSGMDNVMAMSHATAALRNLVTDPKHHTDSVAQDNGIDTLFDVLHQYPHQSVMVHDILTILTVVAESNVDQHKVAILTARPDNGAMKCLCTVMQAQLGKSLPVQAQACTLLHVLTVVDKGRSKIIQAGGVASMYAAMKYHLKDKDDPQNDTVQRLHKHGRAAFRHLLPEPAAEALERMQHYKEWKEQQHVITLRQFAAEQDNKNILAQAGAIDVLVEAMQRNANDAELQEQACGALLSLSSADSADQNHPSFNAKNNNKKMIADAGGIDAIVKALGTHHMVMDVQAYGCRALWSLATFNDNKTIIGATEMGGIPAIINALSGHGKVAIVAENALPALAELAANVENGKIIGTTDGAMDIILTVMQHHDTNAQVQQFACHIFSNLAANDENKIVIAKAGAIPTILTSMQRHAEHAPVQIYACSALGNLALNAENKDLIAKENGISVILQTMLAHDAQPAVLDKACGALRNLSTVPHIKAIVKKEGGVEAVKDALQRHPQLEAVANSVLQNLKS